MNNIPSLYASGAGNEGRNSFPRHAARIAVITPCLAVALSKASSLLVKNHPDQGGHFLVLGLGLVSFLLLVAGLILGILAILLMRPGGRRGVVLPAAAGILMSGLLMAIFVPNFVRARSIALSQHQTLEDVHAASKDFKQETVTALKDGRPPDASHFIKALDAASDSATGGTAAILKGTTAYLEKAQALQSDYDAASHELIAADVLRGRDLTERDQLQARRAVVQKFLAANAALSKYIEQSEATYRTELRRQGVSPAEMDAAAAGFHKASASQQPLVIEIRQTDARVGDAMLRLLDVLDSNWGEWRYDSATNRKIFRNPDVLQQYNAGMQEISDARTDQDAARQKLVALMSQPTPAF